MTSSANKHDYFYYIVEFEDGLQIIPRNWFAKESKEEAFFPNCKSFKMYDKLAENMSPPEESWTKYAVQKVLGKAKTFRRGKDKLKEAEFESDLSTESEDRRKKARHERAKKRVYSSESEDERPSSSSMNRPSFRMSGSDEEFPAFPEMAKHQSTPLAKPLDYNLFDGKRSKEKREKSSTSRRSTTFPKEIDFQGDSPVLRYLSGIRTTVNALFASQKALLERLGYDETGKVKLCGCSEERKENDVNSGDIGELFPVASMAALASVEEKLNNHSFKMKCVKEFRKIGGRNLNTIVYNLMPKMLNDEIADQYSWFGAKGKQVFSTLKLAGVIQETVRHHLAEATNSEVEGPIKKWLSKARERMGNKKKRLAEHDQLAEDGEDSHQE